jgi:hypothetical protein
MDGLLRMLMAGRSVPRCADAVNLQWLKAKLPDRAPGAFDVCLCAGDVSDNLDVLKEALAVLTARFNETFFVAGNHDLWVRPPPINDGRPSFTTSLDRACVELAKPAPPHVGLRGAPTPQ